MFWLIAVLMIQEFGDTKPNRFEEILEICIGTICLTIVSIIILWFCYMSIVSGFK